MPVSKKRSASSKANRSNSSTFTKSKAQLSTLYGDWINVWHGVRVVAGDKKFFRDDDDYYVSKWQRFLRLPRYGFFPKLVSIANPRKAHKEFLYILLNMRWTVLLIILMGFYLSTVMFFGSLFLACGEGLSVANAFNLSFHSLTTIGYGHLYPKSRCANYVITIEAFCAMLIVSLITGLVFAKFAKPKVQIAFSNVCVIQPYGDQLALVLRAANATDSNDIRRDVIMEANFKVTLLRIEKLREESSTTLHEAPVLNHNTVLSRRFSRSQVSSETTSNLVLCSYDLDLVQSDFITFRMGVALVHIIDSHSPLYGLSYQDVVKSDMALHLAMSGVDSTLQDKVTETFVYTSNDIRWGEKFQEMLDFDEESSTVVLDFAKLSVTTASPITLSDDYVTRQRRPSFGFRRRRSFSNGTGGGEEEKTITTATSDIDIIAEHVEDDDEPSTTTNTHRRARPDSMDTVESFGFEEDEEDKAAMAMMMPRRHTITTTSSCFSMEPLFEPLMQNPIGTTTTGNTMTTDGERRISKRIGNFMQRITGGNNNTRKRAATTTTSSNAAANISDSAIEEGRVQHEDEYHHEEDIEWKSDFENEILEGFDKVETPAEGQSPLNYRLSRHSTSSMRGLESTPKFLKISPRHIPGKFTVMSLYYKALHVHWSSILSFFVLVFFGINLTYGALYFIRSSDLKVVNDVNITSVEASFFFSVHTLTTIGYGSISPQSTYINFWVAVEATIGLIIITLLTGISWAKFARPRAHILFSSNILITRLYGQRCLVFRAANTRHHGDIRESTFQIGVLLTNSNTGLRHLYNVPLVTSEWPSFTLSTTMIHVIDKASPFDRILCENDISSYRVSVIALFTGLDTTFSESVYARKMYFWDDFVFNKHFQDNVVLSPSQVSLDFSTFNTLVPDDEVLTPGMQSF